MPSFKENTNIDDWYKHKEPLPRSEWRSSKIMSTGSPENLRSSFVFDECKCNLCGGKGMRQVKAPKGRKRFVVCDCEYGQGLQYWSD